MPSPLAHDNAARLFKELLRRDFTSFAKRAWREINGGVPADWNWHLDAMVHQLNRVERGECLRLLINLPPRNGKSNLVSVIWVAWMLGQDPALSFVCVSYSNELSAKLARLCLVVMETDWYRELFPRTVISRRRSASQDFDTTRGGGRLATSTGGSLTGRGGDFIILDDLIKPEDANSEAAREGLINWFRSTLSSRLNNKESGAILCVMQRLHQYDLCGMLIEQGGWEHLALPAIAKEKAVIPLPRGRVQARKAGEALHPQREPVEVLEALRKEMSSAVFAAQYQQEPVPAFGNLFKARWLKTYAEVPELASGHVVQSWDSAIKTGDANSYSVCITAIVIDRKVYVLDVWRGRLEFPDLRRKVVELASHHQPETLLIEDKASGQQLIQELRSRSAPQVPYPVACAVDQDKVSRAAGVSGMVEAGQLWLPHDAPWLAQFKVELLAFPSGRFDDQVDALVQLLAWFRRFDAFPESTGDPPEIPDEGEDSLVMVDGRRIDPRDLMDEGDVYC